MSSKSPLILITSANGRQAREIIPVLLEQDLKLRLFVHSHDSARDLHETFPKLSPDAFAVGDFLEQHTVDLAMKGVTMVIHIGPPFHPQEAACGTIMIDAAWRQDVGHFVFSSALHPLRQKMLNHKVKLEVEEYLIESGLHWTILQPTHMMQTTVLEPVLSNAMMKLPYSPATVQGFIDLADFAEVVLKVVQHPSVHDMARYELLGCVGSYNEVADIIGKKIGKSVKVEQIPAEQAAAASTSHPYSQDAMKRMMYYYNTRGLTGNSNVLRWLLGREPSTWNEYLDRVLKK